MHLLYFIIIMKKYLVKYNGNYADEFDVYFHSIMTKEQLEEAKGLIQKIGWNEEEFWFGTNESIEVSSKELLEWLNKATEITDEQLKTIQDLGISTISFGDGLNWNDIIEYAIEQIENE